MRARIEKVDEETIWIRFSHESWESSEFYTYDELEALGYDGTTIWMHAFLKRRIEERLDGPDIRVKFGKKKEHPREGMEAADDS